MSDHVEVHTRLKTLFTAMYRENDHERSNAAGALYRHLIANKIHAKDIDLLVGGALIERNQQVIGHLEAEIRRLGYENAYFRQHTPAAVVRQAVRAGKVEAEPWFVLYDLMLARWGKNGELPHNWRRLLCEVLKVTPSEVMRWQNGLAAVPDTALATLRAAPPLVEPDKGEKVDLTVENRQLKRQLANTQRHLENTQRHLEQARQQVAQARRKGVQRSGKSEAPVGADQASIRKKASYDTLKHQNNLLLRLLSALSSEMPPPITRAEMTCLAEEIWGDNFRKPLADLFHLTSVNINNIMPSKTGKIYNKPPAYFAVLRHVHTLIFEYGWAKDAFVATDDPDPERSDIDDLFKE